jgi:hypothetical protein
MCTRTRVAFAFTVFKRGERHDVVLRHNAVISYYVLCYVKIDVITRNAVALHRPRHRQAVTGQALASADADSVARPPAATTSVSCFSYCKMLARPPGRVVEPWQPSMSTPLRYVGCCPAGGPAAAPPQSGDRGRDWPSPSSCDWQSGRHDAARQRNT